MLRQRTTRSTRPPVPLTASSNDSAMPPDDHTPLLQPPSPSRASKGPPSLPTTISSLDAAFEPTLPISPSSGSSTLSDSHTREAPDASMDLSSLSRKSQWITLAVASGACAAFNGVFAKLYVFFPHSSFISLNFLASPSAFQRHRTEMRQPSFALKSPIPTHAALEPQNPFRHLEGLGRMTFQALMIRASAHCMAGR